MTRVVIAGAGFGGIAAAVRLRRELGAGQVTLIDRRPDFVMGLRKSWAALGIDGLEGGRRRLNDIDGIDFRQAEITAVDVGRRAVEVDGQRIVGEALVIALGAQQSPTLVPGLAEHGINIWDRAEVDRAHDALAALEQGRLLIGVFGMPYSCPPAPLELALLARERLATQVEITVASPAPIALPAVGPDQSARIERLLDERGVSFLAGRQAVAVSAERVDFADGSSTPFDVLLGVPPHRCPGVLVAAGLAPADGWLRPNPRTLELEAANVYAVGDCTAIPLANGMALPKAGVFAHAEGEVVAARIAARLRGEEPAATFDGVGLCFLETGRGEAARAEGSFLADPPHVVLSEPDAATLAAKHEFERSRLAAWFGG
jgi:sulfide:quinone oxidoreductase